MVPAATALPNGRATGAWKSRLLFELAGPLAHVRLGEQSVQQLGVFLGRQFGEVAPCLNGLNARAETTSELGRPCSMSGTHTSMRQGYTHGHGNPHSGSFVQFGGPVISPSANN